MQGGFCSVCAQNKLTSFAVAALYYRRKHHDQLEGHIVAAFSDGAPGQALYEVSRLDLHVLLLIRWCSCQLQSFCEELHRRKVASCQRRKLDEPEPFKPSKYSAPAVAPEPAPALQAQVQHHAPADAIPALQAQVEYHAAAHSAAVQALVAAQVAAKQIPTVAGSAAQRH